MNEADKPLTFNDLLELVAIDPKRVIALRHRPSERKLRRVLPWLAAEHAEVFNAYQQTQRPTVEKAFLTVDHVAAFIGQEPGRATFVGLYRRDGQEPITPQDFRAKPAVRRLIELGLVPNNRRDTMYWFDLQPSANLAEYSGRLIIDWPGGERTWWRRSERNRFKVLAIAERDALNIDVPHWNEVVLNWAELRTLPQSWRLAFQQWRAIYYIFDTHSRKGYVGSAYGERNLMQRRQEYAETGHGGDVELKPLNAQNFRFSILQLLAPDLPMDEVVRVESNWKSRLHTREFGLNRT